MDRADNRQRVTSDSKLDAPGFLLFMVIAFMFWSIGFVDLLAHPANNPNDAFLGPYSRGVLSFIGAYVVLFLLWLGLLLVPRSHLAVRQGIVRIQRQPILALTFYALLTVAGWHILTWPKWLDFPGVGTTLFLFLILLGVIVLLWHWAPNGTLLLWRKIVVGLLSVLLLIELIAQGLAWSGNLPGVQYRDGGYAARGRIYQNLEGSYRGGIANNFGVNYPDLRLESGSRRILLLGDTFVQGLQVEPEAQMGVLFEKYIQETLGEEAAPTEVFALGHAGYGPSVFLDTEMLSYADNALAPQEIVVFMHLGNDLRNRTVPSDLDVTFAFEEGELAIYPDDFDRWHDVAHYVLNAYEPLNPLRILRSHYLTPVLGQFLIPEGAKTLASDSTANPLDIPGVRGAIDQRSRLIVSGHQPVERMKLVETPGWSNYLFHKESSDEAEESFHITRLLLERFQEEANRREIELRLVTIPVFPPAFFQQTEDASLAFELADYDLLLPERRLRSIADDLGIPMLAMGQKMRSDRLAAGSIQDFFFKAGTGHLTATGHAYFAEAMYGCFWTPTEAGFAETVCPDKASK